MVVPACNYCQDKSRRAEAGIALALLPEDHTHRDFDDWRKRIAHARRIYPELVTRVVETTREARTICKQLGIRPPPGFTYKQVPLATLDAEEWDALFNTVAMKMILASHYRCFGTPLSRTGRLIARLIPNAHAGDGEWLKSLIGGLPNLEIGRHGNENLGTQIMTRWQASRDGNLAMFITRVQSAFMIVGMTGESPEWREYADANGGSPPFH